MNGGLRTRTLASWKTIELRPENFGKGNGRWGKGNGRWGKGNGKREISKTFSGSQSMQFAEIRRLAGCLILGVESCSLYI